MAGGEVSAPACQSTGESATFSVHDVGWLHGGNNSTLHG